LCTTYHWKFLDEGYNFDLDLILIRGLHTKLWVSKVATIPILGISGLALGSPETKWHLGAGLMAKHKVYYKGEGSGFPPSPGRGESCEFVFACGSFMHQKGSSYALANLLFGLCKSVWVIELLVNLPSPHPGAPTCPFTPKVLRAKERAPSHSPSVVLTFRFAMSPSRSLGVHHALLVAQVVLYFVIPWFWYTMKSPDGFCNKMFWRSPN
jgi:hypothetical protein